MDLQTLCIIRDVKGGFSTAFIFRIISFRVSKCSVQNVTILRIAIMNMYIKKLYCQLIAPTSYLQKYSYMFWLPSIAILRMQLFSKT